MLINRTNDLVTRFPGKPQPVLEGGQKNPYPPEVPNKPADLPSSWNPQDIHFPSIVDDSPNPPSPSQRTIESFPGLTPTSLRNLQRHAVNANAAPAGTPTKKMVFDKPEVIVVDPDSGACKFDKDACETMENIRKSIDKLLPPKQQGSSPMKSDGTPTSR